MENEISSNRVEYLDIAKGIAIILVVMGHCYSEKTITHSLIYGCHMPFFFIATGMVYGLSKKEIKICKQIKRYLIPYVIFEVWFSLFIVGLGQRENFLSALLGSFKSIVLLRGVSTPWYLPCSLMAQIIFALILKTRIGKLGKAVLVCAVAGAGIAIPGYEAVAILRSCVGVGFVALGYYLAPQFNKKASWWIISGCFVAYAVFVAMNREVDLCTRKFSNPVLYFGNGLVGTYVLMQISMVISHKSASLKTVICDLGKNSMIVLCTHMFFVEIIRLLDYKFLDNILSRCGEMEGYIFGGLIILIEIALLPLFTKKLYFLFGMKKCESA